MTHIVIHDDGLERDVVAVHGAFYRRERHRIRELCQGWDTVQQDEGEQDEGEHAAATSATHKVLNRTPVQRVQMTQWALY